MNPNAFAFTPTTNFQLKDVAKKQQKSEEVKKPPSPKKEDPLVTKLKNLKQNESQIKII